MSRKHLLQDREVEATACFVLRDHLFCHSIGPSFKGYLFNTWPLSQNAASAFVCVAYLDIVFVIIGRKFISTIAAFQIRLQLFVGHTRGIISCFECDLGLEVSDLQEAAAILIDAVSMRSRNTLGFSTSLCSLTQHDHIAK